MSQPEASELFISNNSLQAGQNYQWRVRCGCQANPIIAGPWSPYDQFSLGSAREFSSSGNSNEESLRIAPNPTAGLTKFFLTSSHISEGSLSVFNITGKLVYQQNLSLNEGANMLEIDLSDQPSGLYLVKGQWGNSEYQSKLIIR